jgi:CHAD domain-containing protein
MSDSHHSDHLIRQRLQVLTRTLPAACSGNPEAIHQARVATRRLRAALPLLAKAGRKGRKLTKAVTRLTRDLGHVRELDVALMDVDKLAADTVTPGEGVQLLRAALREQRQHLFVKMARRVQRVDLDRLQRKALAVAEDGQAHGRRVPADPRTVSATARRSKRRAVVLKAAIENAGGIYLPDRLHQVRIAVKKLRYVLEIGRELTRSRASARIRLLKSVQDTLGRMHDLEMLIMHIRALQGSDRAPTLKASADLDRMVRRLEMECRQLHVRYIGFKKKLLELCDDVTSASERPRASAA